MASCGPLARALKRWLRGRQRGAGADLLSFALSIRFRGLLCRTARARLLGDRRAKAPSSRLSREASWLNERFHTDP
jgi:hypothetical protein